MLSKGEMMARVEAVIAARSSGVGAAAMNLVAPDATYEIAADVANLPGFPPAGPAAAAIGPLIGLITYRDVTYGEPIVDGDRLAVEMFVDAEAHGRPHRLRLCTLWQFDAQGRPRSLTEYADTAAMRDWLTGGAAAPMPRPTPAPMPQPTP